MNDPKLTIPILGFNQSGGMRIISELANHMTSQGWVVEILCPEDAAEPLFPLSDTVKIKTYPIWGHSWIRIISALLQICISSCNKTTVCLANYYPTSFAIFLSWLLWGRNAQLVYLIQGYEPLIMMKPNRNQWINRFMATIANTSYRLPFDRIAVSSWIQSKINREMSIIPNGIDTTLFYATEAIKSQNTTFTIGAIGRTASIKGFDIFCKAVGSFLTDPNIEIMILSDELNIAPQGMTLVQAQSDDDIRDFYQSCDVFIYPSRMDGFGLPPLEAMACGTPVILTDSGGVLEYANAQNAIIVAVDDNDAIAEAIMTLYNTPSERKRLRQEGLKTAYQFSKEAMLRKYQIYFEEYKSL